MKHRKQGAPRLTPHRLDFKPLHCAGASCMHAHPAEKPLPTTRFHVLQGGKP